MLDLLSINISVEIYQLIRVSEQHILAVLQANCGRLLLSAAVKYILYTSLSAIGSANIDRDIVNTPSNCSRWREGHEASRI